jgi:hypothetical protein
MVQLLINTWTFLRAVHIIFPSGEIDDSMTVELQVESRFRRIELRMSCRREEPVNAGYMIISEILVDQEKADCVEPCIYVISLFSLCKCVSYVIFFLL